MTGPHDPPAAGRDQLRAGHADREQVIDTLKDAFTQGRLTGAELDARTGQALAARTYAELDALTADIPRATRLDGPPALARRWPLARAAVTSAGFLIIAGTVAYSGNMIDNSVPNAPGPGPHHGWTRLLLLLTLTLIISAVAILGRGVADSLEHRRSRKQLPPGPGGHPLDAGLHGRGGHDLLPRTKQAPADQTPADLVGDQAGDQAGADMRPDNSRPRRPHPSARNARAPHGMRPALDGG